MVQGLGFLSKKSWHTKNLANQEKVWMAEQQKEAEAQKTKELAKQIQQEREQEELDKIAGKKTTMDRGINWMYEGNSGQLAKEDAEKKAEEFLLGKEFVGGGATSGDFDAGDSKEGIHNVVSHVETTNEATTAAHLPPDAPVGDATLPQEPSVKDRNESFRMRVEDPMFLVSQKQHEKESKLQQTKALYKRVVGYDEEQNDEDEDEESRHKRSKKERKRHKKKSKRSSREKESHRGGREDRKRNRHHRDRSRSRSRSASREPARKHRRRDRSRSRSRSSSGAGVDRDSRRRHDHGSTHRGHRRKDDRKDSHRGDDHKRKRRHEGDSRRDEKHRSSRYSSDDSEERYRCKRDGRGHSKHDRRRSEEETEKRSSQQFKEDSQKQYDNTRDRKPPPSDDHGSRKKEGYGLQNASSTKKLDKDDLGPSKALLQKKREEREAERQRVRGLASSRRRTTSEERAKAIKEMESNARRREESMAVKAKQRPTQYGNGEEDHPSMGNASFLTDITKQTHGLSGEGTSLSARVAQNRHTNQRSHESFL